MSVDTNVRQFTFYLCAFFGLLHKLWRGVYQPLVVTGCALSIIVTYGADNTVIDIVKSVSCSATNSFTVASEEIFF